ncbi:choice-of-anchor A family protein [Streptomyces monticola]|uniref:Choice-of-anchor A family protein n=1 Tax=Streptomyces monticola TaxID=2666263 RepID=A0ABW2JRK5_9ACTN
MRISASAAAFALAGSLVLAGASGAAATSQPSQSCATGNLLGTAGHYNEFVEGDALRAPDSEGAVAIGGDADFTGGFSVGGRLASTASLPGGASLVVGGTLTSGEKAYTVLEHGNGVYGGLTGRDVEVKDRGATAGQGKSPVDFAAEFAKLRALSNKLTANQANGTVQLSGSGQATRLALTGKQPGLNVFTVDGAQLQRAKHIVISAPEGATVLVNVTGGAYDQATAATYRIDGRAGRLLWNFPTATKVTKHSHNAWPGTVLAPNAAVDLGDGGPVNGTVIAKSLRGTGSAETHHHPFTGCLTKPAGDETTQPSNPEQEQQPNQDDSTAAPTAPGHPDEQTPATDKDSAAPAPVQDSSSPSPAGHTSGPDDHSKPAGLLALTGGNVGPLAGMGAAVVTLGAGFLYMARRRATPSK